MKYTRFEDLPVWQDAMELTERIFTLTEDRAFAGKGDLRNQLQRAALSICNNIAEGFERGTTQELLTFLYIAKGSAGEVRSMLCLTDRMPGLHDLRSQISDLRGKAESIARQLRAWAEKLQNSDIKGHRYLTQADRDRQVRERETEEFVSELKAIVSRGRETTDTNEPPA